MENRLPGLPGSFGWDHTQLLDCRRRQVVSRPAPDLGGISWLPIRNLQQFRVLADFERVGLGDAFHADSRAVDVHPTPPGI